MRARQLRSIFTLIMFVVVVSFLISGSIEILEPDPASPDQQDLEQTRSLESEEAIVTRVIDGDTVEINTGQKVRYIGIDTPEDPRSKNAECFALNSYMKNKELVMGKKIRMEKDVSETDRYQRLLRYVYVDDLFVNLEMVSSGYAVAQEYPPDTKHAYVLSRAESAAKLENRGIWRYCRLEPEGEDLLLEFIEALF